MSEMAKAKSSARPVELVRDGMILVGAGLVAYGAWLAWPPAGFIVAGLGLLVPGVVGAVRAPQRSDGGGA